MKPKVRNYLGGQNVDNIADHVIAGEAANPSIYFSMSVSGAGDFDGDGYSEIISGGYGLSNPVSNAYIYRYPQSGTDIPDEYFTGTAPGDWLGSAMNSAGDVNGDGFSDVIVGAYRNDDGGVDAGKAYIYFGGFMTDNVADVVLTGAAPGDQFGFSVAGVGDVNSDGFDDVAVGAPLNDAPGANAGRAYIYFGGSSMDATPDVTLSGQGPHDQFGYSVSGGDFNGNGFSINWNDVLVGAPFNDAGAFDAGSVYIYLGSYTMDNIPDVIYTGFGAGEWFGISVSTAGDLNYDAFADIIIGAMGSDYSGTDAGRVFIYSGGTFISSSPDVTLNGVGPFDRFGCSVSGCGDVNGDFYGDVVVGAYLQDANGTDAGRAYVYYGGANMNQFYDIAYTGLGAGDNFGTSVAGAGDINSDGFNDVIVEAPYCDVPYTDAGRAYVYFGSAAVDVNADIIYSGEYFDDSFGSCVASAGNVNADFQPDLLIGAPLFDANGFNAGRGYLHISTEPLQQLVLTTKLTIEGFYDSAPDNMNSSDTVRINLHDINFPYPIVDQAKAVVNKNNLNGKFFFKNAPTGYYYLEVLHRNSIRTWSSFPVHLVLNTNYVYNFMVAATNSYGNNVQQVDTSPQRFGIYSGDVNQDDAVDAADVIAVYNDANNFISGYVNTDVTGDYYVDVTDLLVTYNNSNNFVVAVTP